MHSSTPHSPPHLERISDYVHHYAASTPNAVAATCDAFRLSYQELAAQVDACASALLRMGIQPGDRVATLSPPHPDFWIIFLAATSVGAIWVGLNPRHTLPEYRYVIQDSKPRVVFARTRIGDRRYHSELEALRRDNDDGLQLVLLDRSAVELDAPSFAELLARQGPNESAELAEARSRVRASDPALLVYTSGTTGQPKGALISHHSLVRCSRVQVAHVPVTPLKILNNLPINHIGCVGDISCYALVAGGSIAFMEQFDPEGTLRVIESERLTVWGQVPTMFQLTLSTAATHRYDLSSLQLIVWSGAAASRDLIRQLSALCPRLASSYGMTETVGSVAMATECSQEDVLAETVGWPVPDYELRIADPSGRALGVGEPGEIQVRGDFIMLRYWNNPSATSQAIDAEGWLHTGDLGELRADGALKLVGRLKEMFKSGGYNVYPREIEQLLETHPDVAMAAVIGVSDPLYGEVGHAFVAPKRGALVNASELEAHCRGSLAAYKVPKRFVISESLPTLPIGKLDRRALSELADIART